MSKQQKLSERFEAWQYQEENVYTDFREKLLPALRALEAENERLRGEVADAQADVSWTKRAEAIADKHAVFAERDALRAEVEMLRRDFERSLIRGDGALNQRDTAIRERDEARAELDAIKRDNDCWNEAHQDCFDTKDERDAALAKLAKVREWCKEAMRIPNVDPEDAGEHVAYEAILDILDIPVRDNSPDMTDENWHESVKQMAVDTDLSKR